MIKAFYFILAFYVCLSSQEHPEEDFVDVPEEIGDEWVPVDVNFKGLKNDVPIEIKNKYTRRLTQLKDLVMGLLDDLEVALKRKSKKPVRSANIISDLIPKVIEFKIDWKPKKDYHFDDGRPENSKELIEEQKKWKRQEKNQPWDLTLFLRDPAAS